MEILFVLSIALNFLLGITWVVQKDIMKDQNKFIDVLIAKDSWH